MSHYQVQADENEANKLEDRIEGREDYSDSRAKRIKRNDTESVSLESQTLEAEKQRNSGVSKTKLKMNKMLPVYIVEQHNDVLPFIHRAIGSRQLPFSGIPFIHLDSHPDLLIPINMDADLVKKPQQLYDSISIENWLLPLTYAKHVDHIVWIKPPWANQILPSSQSFAIGKCQESGKLRLSCKENYFLTDGLFRPLSHLDNSSNIKLTVVDLCPQDWSNLDPSYEEIQGLDDSRMKDSNPDFHSHKSWAYYLQSIVQDKPYILDMDLDFFSTTNPFKDVYSEEEENALKRLFKCPPLTGMSDEEVSVFTSQRQNQLFHLERLFSNADELWSQKTDAVPEFELSEMTLSKMSGTSEKFLEYFNSEEKNDIMSICLSLLRSDRKSRDVTFSQLHDFGCTLDDTELPHHISSDKQVSALEEALEDVMKILPRPTIVTISRSSHDEYCPADKVDIYQTMFLNILRKLYGDLVITENY